MNTAELKYLIGLCDREISYCGLDTEPGRKALRVRKKLEHVLETLKRLRKSRLP